MMGRLLHSQVVLVLALVGLQILTFISYHGADCLELKKISKIMDPLIKKIRANEKIKSSFSEIGELVLNTISAKTLKLLQCLGASDCPQPAEKDPEPTASPPPVEESPTDKTVMKLTPEEISSETSYEQYDEKLFSDSEEDTKDEKLFSDLSEEAKAPTNVGSAPDVGGKSIIIPGTQTAGSRSTNDHSESALISLLRNVEFKMSIPINIVNNQPALAPALAQSQQTNGKTKPSTYTKPSKVTTVVSHYSEPLTYDYMESPEQTIDYSYESLT